MVFDEHLSKVAAETTHTISDLRETADKLEQAIQSRLPEHFQSSRLYSGLDYWVLEHQDGRDRGIWLAFNKFELHEEMRETDIEFGSKRLLAVAHAHLDQFQALDLTLAIPGPISRKYEDPFFFPIFVSYPPNWEDSEWNTYQRFEELVGRYGLTPAEALDYWVLTRTNFNPTDWAGTRDVHPEAVRKNVRQAKDKMADIDAEPRRERNQIRAVDIDDIPDDSPHDTDTDLFYIPTAESARNAVE